MNSQSSLRQNKMPLDKNVWLVMISSAFLSLVLISYRIIDKKSCIAFSISVKSLLNNESGFYETGETLVFKTSSPQQKDIIWEFNDGTDKEKTAGTSLRHKFLKEGIFTITASINGKCSNEMKVNISNLEKGTKLVEDLNNKLFQIYNNPVTLIGKPELFQSNIVGSSYEWKILDKSTFPTLSIQYASFTFPKPGTYTVQLTVDHDRKKRVTTQITVSEDPLKANIKKPGTIPILIPSDLQVRSHKEIVNKLPEDKPVDKPIDKPLDKPNELINPESVPTERKILYISNEIFKSKLEAVVEGKLDVEDFEKYLFYGSKVTKVRANNKGTGSFSDFLPEIRGKKKIIIESVDLKRDESKYVQQISIFYRKKTLIDKIF